MGFWTNKTVVVTGGAGFLGSFIVEQLEKLDSTVRTVVPRSKDYDLVDPQACHRLMKDAKPHVVIHGAAFYGGIWINQLHPGKIFYQNLVMGAHLMEASREAGVEKFLGIGTACSYPGYLEGELREEQLWDGPPHESVINYGLTKKMMAIQGWAYRKEFNFNAIHVLLTNLYGPRDTFHIRRAHVVSALIKKFVEAVQTKASEVEVWGTGKPVREFLYVEDCAEGILRAVERYSESQPINIGTGVGTTILELVEQIRDVTGFKGKLRWNTEKPDGQMRKVLNVDRMKSVLQWQPRTSLRDGLKKTIDWYIANKEAADQRL
ncbi:MAG: NAD-dependent epimerase/dehydratase family protein [Verrucomicrobiae bacterium]|nr:NAD-dependent epimerase/dehydratase family protein [Verrucomicrobiae bacterium]